MTSTALHPEDLARFGPDPRATFAANLSDVRARIEAACRSVGRSPSEVRLLPISKTVPARVLRLAVQAGIHDLGENKIQEASEKHEELADLPVRFSIVGHLQTNKVKLMAGFAWEFHALDSLKLARELDKRLEASGREMDVFVQVNTSGEASKFGLAPDELLPFLSELHAFPRLKPRGLMTLAVFSDETERVRACFQRLRALRDEAREAHPEIEGLSMGMSGDFELAIHEGSTVVRVGQGLFGARPGSDAHYWPGLIPG